MLDEMRVYHPQPVKLPAVLDRFVTITLTIQYLAIRQTRFWTASVHDHECQVKNAETEANGPLLTHFSDKTAHRHRFFPPRRPLRQFRVVAVARDYSNAQMESCTLKPQSRRIALNEQ